MLGPKGLVVDASGPCALFQAMLIPSFPQADRTWSFSVVLMPLGLSGHSHHP